MNIAPFQSDGKIRKEGFSGDEIFRVNIKRNCRGLVKPSIEEVFAGFLQ